MIGAAGQAIARRSMGTQGGRTKVARARVEAGDPSWPESVTRRGLATVKRAAGDSLTERKRRTSSTDAADERGQQRWAARRRRYEYAGYNHGAKPAREEAHVEPAVLDQPLGHGGEDASGFDGEGFGREFVAPSCRWMEKHHRSGACGPTGPVAERHHARSPEVVERCVKGAVVGGIAGAAGGAAGGSLAGGAGAGPGAAAGGVAGAVTGCVTEVLNYPFLGEATAWERWL